jgi:hypothetical protein
MSDRDKLVIHLQSRCAALLTVKKNAVSHVINDKDYATNYAWTTVANALSEAENKLITIMQAFDVATDNELLSREQYQKLLESKQ